MGRALQTMLLLVLVIALGAGGYLLWTVQTQRASTVRQWEDTKTALAERQEQLDLLEQEQRKLAESYEALKSRWTESDEALTRATANSEQLTKDTERLTSERAELQQQVGDAKAQADRLQEQARTLEQERSSLAKEKASVTARLRDASELSRSQAGELEALKRALAEQEAREATLSNQIEGISHAYEQMAQERRRIQEATDAEPLPVASGGTADGFFTERPNEERPQLSWRLSFDRPAKAEPEGADKLEQLLTSLTEGAPKRSIPGDDDRATFYRELGQAYHDARQYEKAAEALEQSLELRDDPNVHRQLADLYGRVLKRPSMARLHAVKSDRRSATEATRSTFPRTTWSLVFDWLAKQ